MTNNIFSESVHKPASHLEFGEQSLAPESKDEFWQTLHYEEHFDVFFFCKCLMCVAFIDLVGC